MEAFDPYDVLALPPGAGRKAVEVSYHRLQATRPPLSTTQLALVDRAYLALSDPERRKGLDVRSGRVIHPGFSVDTGDRAGRCFEAGRRAAARGDWRRAAAAFGRATACQPWEAEYRSWLGLAVMKAGGDPRRAVDLCLEAFRLDRGSHACRGHLAEVYRRLGMYRRASRLIEK